MEYILSHLPQTLIVVGLILLAIEVMVLGFSTFVLFFIGLGTIMTGALMAVGLLPETLLMALLAFLLASIVDVQKMQMEIEMTLMMKLQTPLYLLLYHLWVLLQSI